MKFNVKASVVNDVEMANTAVTIGAEDGDVFVNLDNGVEVQMTPTQAKDLMFSLRKAAYEAQRETRNTKKYQQKGGVR